MPLVPDDLASLADRDHVKLAAVLARKPHAWPEVLRDRLPVRRLIEPLPDLARQAAAGLGLELIGHCQSQHLRAGLRDGPTGELRPPVAECRLVHRCKGSELIE